MSNITEYNLSNLPTADVVKEWSQDIVKEFLQRNRTDLELEENDINVIYGQNVTGKAFLHLKEEQLTRNPGPFKLLFGPASAIEDVVKQINGDLSVTEVESLTSDILTSGITGLQLQDKEIWVRYNNERVSLPENVLEVFKVSNVDDLKWMIKARFNISENVTIRSRSDNLEGSKLVTELYNTEDNALEVIVEGNDDESSSSKEKEMEIEESNIEVKHIENAIRKDMKYE